MSHNPDKIQRQFELKLARQSVISQTQILQNLIPPTVNYSTQGNVLIIGSEDLSRLAAEKLSDMASLTILVSDPVTCQEETYLERVSAAAPQIESYYNKLQSIKGFLGQFQVAVLNPVSTNQTGTNQTDEDQSIQLSQIAIRQPHFDVILDLSLKPCLNLEMLPPGYFYVGHDQTKLADAIEQIPNMVGEFDKPRYVKINPDLCAHHRHGMEGCNRCLNFCPADAISSVDHQIDINPYLCHGAGSCTNACPTGALSYDLPTPASLHNYLHKLISRYWAQVDEAPVILFHATDAELDLEQLSGEVLPVELEEIAVAGIDHWMAALAWGARQVLILSTESTAFTLKSMLEGETSLANRILAEIGQPQRINLVSDLQSSTINELLTSSNDWPITAAANFELSSKRNVLFNAIDHLNQQAAKATTHLMMSNIPYGTVSIKEQDCTLCLGCVASCPTQALKDGGDEPALRFIEQECVQCGLCETACPEKVISLIPRVNLDPAQRQKLRTLKQETPFECIVCGTPFATQSMVHRMLDMVGSHSAFSANIERLKMCGDCRVKDVFEDILQDPEKQLN